MEKLDQAKPICKQCGARMWLSGTIPSAGGDIAIYRCPDCNRLYWQAPDPKQDEQPES